ncbi:MAG: OmpA family protein [Verrucomicrobiales bacterium]|nr:OmpA family protein [Verrucomicrobiales bacterium]
MNYTQKALLAGGIAALLGFSHSTAQNYYSPPSTHSMIESLRGHSGHNHSQAPTLRSTEACPICSPKGHADYNQGSGQLSYHVDSSCQLCTNQIQFLRNSTDLADHQSYEYLQNLAHALQSPDLQYQRFVIEGHASAEGTRSVNLTLSQRRANAIFDFLVSYGVHPSRLLSVGHGESQAQYPSNASEYLRANDRKVIVYKMAG